MFRKILLSVFMVGLISLSGVVHADHSSKGCDRGHKECDHSSKGCDHDHKGCASEAHLPCPIMALNKAKELGLDKKQTAELTKIKKEVTSKTTSLKAQVDKKNEALVKDILAEKVLDADLGKRVDEIASLQGQLRLAKLRAHLQTMKSLTPEQINKLSGGECDHKGKKDDKGKSPKSCCNEKKACDIK